MPELGSLGDAWDARIRQVLADDVAAVRPAWFGGAADEDFAYRILQRAERARRLRPAWPWVASLAAAALLGLALLHPGAPRSNAGTTALTATLAQEGGSLLNEAISPTSVRLTEAGPEATLTNTAPGRWRTMTFRLSAGGWQPTSLSAVVAGLSVTYQVALGSRDPGILLPAGVQAALERRLAQRPYSAADSQMGALGRLPINLRAAVPLYSVTPANQGKILLQVGSARILALTYPVKGATGQPVYVPVGWYWWAGAPPIMRGSSPPAGSSGS